MSKELEARLDRLEIVVGSLLDELIECKLALKAAEDHMVRSSENQQILDSIAIQAQQQQAQAAQMQNAAAMTQAQLSAASQGRLQGRSSTFSVLDEGQAASTFAGLFSNANGR